MTLQQAREDMDRVSRDLTAAYPDVNSGKKANVLSLKDEMVGNMGPILFVLLGAVAFVLLDFLRECRQPFTGPFHGTAK